MEGKSIKKIGKFRVTQEMMGKGTFSQVFLAYDQNDEKVAAKVISLKDLAQDEVESLEREINILKKCRHENIVSLLDAKKTQNNFYIFLELCDCTLDDHIKNKGKLEVDEAIAILGQIVKGMQTMTVAKIVHRDIKPANILLKAGIVKIADFGLAKKIPKQQLMQSFVGSPLNMAPQILKKHSYTEKVDVYSAGTVLYEMLFGKVPFNGKDYENLLKSIEKGLINLKQTGISKQIRELLKSMLQPNPINRIDMNGIFDWMHGYNQNRKQTKLNYYKALSLKCINGIGAVGCMVGALGLKNIRNSPSPMCMDLRLCSKFYEQLAINFA